MTARHSGHEAAPATPGAERRFRADVRAWLDDHATRRTGVADRSDAVAPTGSDEQHDHLDRCRVWQRTLFDGGWVLGWPDAYGGRPAPAWQRWAFAEEVDRYDVTTGFLAAGIALVGPALLAHGSAEQRSSLLPRLLRGDDVWCQLFSEPGAGSDLAGLATRAVRAGDHFLVDGQKVWTSVAHLADRAILLARTDPHAPKHRGITLFLVDMGSPGIEARPLRTITGTAHFDEVFLSAVRIPAAAVLGDIDHGWSAARTVLADESALMGSTSNRPDGVADLLALARSSDRADDPIVRQALARCWGDEVLLDRLTGRVRADVAAGRVPSVDGSVLKVLWSEARRDRSDLAVRLLGAGAGADDGTDPVIVRWRTELLNRFWGSIGGGTDEIHRNQIAERVLGLPAEPRPDREVPWSTPAR